MQEMEKKNIQPGIKNKFKKPNHLRGNLKQGGSLVPTDTDWQTKTADKTIKASFYWDPRFFKSMHHISKLPSHIETPKREQQLIPFYLMGIDLQSLCLRKHANEARISSSTANSSSTGFEKAIMTSSSESLIPSKHSRLLLKEALHH